MLCILAVFLPSFFMEGAAREMFVPLSLAVGFAMVAAYLLSSTFVAIMAVWLFRTHPPDDAERGETAFDRFCNSYVRLLGSLMPWRRALVGDTSW